MPPNSANVRTNLFYPEENDVMTHIYPQFPGRTIHSLSGLWDFTFCEKADPAKPAWSKLTFTDAMSVPGVFDSLPGTAGRRGVGFYRTFVTTEKQNLLLRIGALGLAGTVWFDRKKIGFHDLVYAPAYFEIQAEKGEHELVIAVDNRLEATPLFRQYYDYYGHGGIYRSCELHELSSWSFRRAKIVTKDLKGVIEAELSFRGNVPEKLSCEILIDGKAAGKKSVAVKNGIAKLKLQVPAPAKIWTPEKPVLHTLTIRSGSEVITERFGLRTIEAKKGQFFLNGKTIILRGICRHETHPQFGPALPDQILLEDIAILKDLGCNFIRGTHYPQDPRFLELCDEKGILVWEEGNGWGDWNERFADPVYQDAQIRQLAPMIEESFNHPCVIIRGFLNECESNTEQGQKFHKLLADETRKLDPARLVTFGSMCAFSDKCFDDMDIVAVNRYPGWYAYNREELRPLGEIEMDLAKVIQWKKEQGWDDKPLIISEIGAGAIYGWRDRMHAHWSEEYQADYLDEVCKVCDEKQINGLAIWQYCDGRTYSSSMALTRPRAFNNKGIVDEYRRYKLSCDVVKKHFRKG